MAVPPNEITRAASHQLFIEKLAASFGNDVIPYLNRIERGTRSILNKLPQRLSDERKAAAIEEIDKLTKSELQAYINEYKVNNRQFGTYEAEKSAEVLDDVVTSDSFKSTPATAAQVNALAVSTPIKLGDNLYTTYNSYLSNYWRKHADQINGIVVNGFNQSIPTDEIASGIMRQISTEYDDSSLSRARRDAKTLARTGTNHMASQARIATVGENEDVIIGWEFVAVIDSRTSQQCSSLDGTTYKLNDPNIPVPPLHPNAVAAGELITTDSGMVAVEDVKVGDLVLTHNGRYMPVTTVMCKKNDTRAVKLVCGDISSVRLTDDHPVLTSEGWKLAGDVRVGDELIYDSSELIESDLSGLPKITNAVLLDAHNKETSVTDELVSYGIFSSSTGVSSAINLNGDISNDKVSNEIATNDNLKIKVNAGIIELVDNNLLVRGRVKSEFISHTDCDFALDAIFVDGVIDLHSLARQLIGSLESLDIDSTPMRVTFGFWGELCTAIDRVLSVSCIDSELNASLSDSVIGKAVLPLYESEALAFDPMLSLNELFNFFVCDSLHALSPYYVTVTSTVDDSIDGYVYNLSVAGDETYFANSLLVHNCRSTLVYEIDGRYSYDDSASERPTNFRVDGKQEAKRVSSKRTYYEEMRKLKAADQDAILGPTLGKAFRKMDDPDAFAKSLIDDTYNPLTIEQMRRRDNQLGRVLRAQQ